MPEISRFLGIVIGMFYSEHGVPHSCVAERCRLRAGISSRQREGHTHPSAMTELRDRGLLA